MNKKLLLATLAAMASSGLCAKHLTPQEALSRAMSQPEIRMGKAPAASSMEIRRILLNPDDAATVYMFAGDGNAIIVPADDRVAPILGYIEGYAEGEIPPQMEWWLSEYSRQIDLLLAQPDTGTGLYVTSRANAAPDNKTPIAPMVTTRWNQDSPYNYDCPVVGGKKAMTGCVATAAAQVMKYHNYPPEGTGTISYRDNTTTRTLQLDGTPFDWDNMIDNYSLNYNTVQRNAVAYLMKAVGYASQMNYGTDVSGAQSENMLTGIKKYFGYNSNATMLNRNDYPLADWENIIYENLQKVGPVYYAGSDNIQGGHAFVCDGYSSDGFFHFNWGWGGAYDGYFKLTALNPEGQGIGGNTGGFNLNQRIVINFTTPDGQTIDLPATSPITLTGNLTAWKESATELAITSDQAESMNVCAYNSSAETVQIEFGLKAVNIASGSEAFQGEGYKRTFITNQGVAGLYLTIPGNLENGKYRMYLVARSYPSGEWLELSHGLSNTDYVNVTISGGSISNVSDAPAGQLEASGIDIQSSIYVGYPMRLSYTVSNNSSTEIYDGLMPYLFTISNGQPQVKAMGEAIAVDMMPGESVDMNVIPTLYALQGASSFSGSAYLGIVSYNTGAILAYVPVTVQPAPTSISASSTGFSMNGDRNAADANNLEFNCGLKVTKGYWAAPLTVYICSLGGEVLHTLSSSETYFLDAGGSASATVSGSFPSGVQGQQYTAIFGYIKNSYYVETLSYMSFKIGNAYSGIDMTSADAEAQVQIVTDRAAGQIVVTAPCDILSIESYSLDGRLLSPEISIDGCRAEVSLSSIPSGVILVKVTLADSTSTVTKIVK